MSTTIKVELGGRSYDVLVGRELLDNLAEHARRFVEPYAGRKVPVVADENARAHHGERLARSLAGAGYEIAWYEVAPGESSKSWESLERLRPEVDQVVCTFAPAAFFGVGAHYVDFHQLEDEEVCRLMDAQAGDGGHTRPDR